MRLIIAQNTMVTASSVQLQCKTANRLAQMALFFAKDVWQKKRFGYYCIILSVRQLIDNLFLTKKLIITVIDNPKNIKQ